jgi:ribosomal protein S12 methylthiotransferase accessory factor
MPALTLDQFTVLDKTLDFELGIVEQVSKIGLQPCEAGQHVAIAIMQNPSAISPHSRHAAQPRPDRQAAGTGPDWIGTLWSTVGEGLERYAASIIEDGRVTIATRTALEGNVVDPDAFILFSEKQRAEPDFAFLTYAPDQPIAWTQAVRVIDSSTAWVPAEMVWLPYPGGAPKRLDRGYSTGLGAHTDPQRAAATAIKELIERDAYLTRFLLKAPPPALPRDRWLGCLPRAIAGQIVKQQLNARVFDLTSEFGVPTALCHILPGPGLGVASGASCAASSGQAITKAVVEAMHTFNWLIDMKRWESCAEREDINDFVDHVTYHRRDAAASIYAAFLTGPERDNFFALPPLPTDPSAELRELVCRLEGAGFPVYLVDITPIDVSDAGFHVFRAVVPGLQPMYAGLGMQHFDPRRLRQVAARLGLDWGDVSLNTEPHPFP